MEPYKEKKYQTVLGTSLRRARHSHSFSVASMGKHLETNSQALSRITYVQNQTTRAVTCLTSELRLLLSKNNQASVFSNDRTN